MELIWKKKKIKKNFLWILIIQDFLENTLQQKMCLCKATFSTHQGTYKQVNSSMI